MKRVIEIYYDDRLRNWDELIELVHAKHGNAIRIIAKPGKSEAEPNRKANEPDTS